jgi:mRNA interferase RelE/StbE
LIYQVKNHPLVEEDLKELDHSLRLLVFKKLKKLQSSPELGVPLGHKNNLDLTGLYKLYVAKKKVRIVYEVIAGEFIVYIVAIGKRNELEVYKKASMRR